MKRAAITVAALLVASSAAVAQTTEQRYQGTFYILTTTPECTGEVARLNRDFLFVLRTDDTRQLLGLFGTPFALSVRTSTSGRFAAAGGYVATKIGSGANVRTYSGEYSTFSTSPSAFTSSTASVLVRGALTNFDEIAGCTVKFRAAGARRPEPF